MDVVTPDSSQRITLTDKSKDELIDEILDLRRKVRDLESENASLNMKV